MRRLEQPTGDGSDPGPLRFIVYSWGVVESDLPWSTQSQFLAALPAWGLTPSPLLAVSDVLDDVKELLAAHTTLASSRLSLAGGYCERTLHRRCISPSSSARLYKHSNAISAVLRSRSSASSQRPSQMGYHVDGVVYKIDSVELQKQLGADSRAPRWAVGHKFPAEEAVTTLSAVEVQVGRTGALTPVAILDPPVELGGATISRATLHNFGDVARKGLFVGRTWQNFSATSSDALKSLFVELNGVL